MTTRINEDIQALRAIAIILVIIHHAPLNLIQALPPFLERFYSYFFGAVGVDLFFVISGFVISRSLLSSLSHQATPQALRSFWLKRAYRIFPAAWLWLTIIIILTLTLNKSGSFGSFRAAYEGSIAAVLNIANIRFGNCYGFFECGPTTVYWSLSLEEQFYIIMPILILIFRKFTPHLLTIFIISQITIDSITLPSTFRMTGLALGVVMGWYSKSQNYQTFFKIFTTNKTKLLIALLFLCLMTVQNPSLNITSERLGYQIVALISGILVYIASMNQNCFFGAGRANHFMCWIGNRSYSLYLSHMPAFFLTREIVYRFPEEALTGQSLLLFSITCSSILMFISADLCFKYVELPFQEKARRELERYRTFDCKKQTITEASVK
ncbi:acyltransferase family protein [Pseudomonas sp. B392_1p]|uniref:acyltransferase family protein n=1 Tax=Pseudomonas sp. B392_1p TaxID=3457507 RepID=UPI003FD58C8E